MPSEHFKERFPRIAYEADDHNQIIESHTSVLEYERFLIAQALGTSDERSHPFYTLDNTGRIIRAFEVENRIFISNENGSLGHLINFHSKLAHKIYISIRGKITGLYGGQPGGKGLLWLLNNLDSIQVILSGDKIIKTIFLMKDSSMNHIDELDEQEKRSNNININ